MQVPIAPEPLNRERGTLERNSGDAYQSGGMIRLAVPPSLPVHSFVELYLILGRPHTVEQRTDRFHRFCLLLELPLSHPALVLRRWKESSKEAPSQYI